MPNGTKTSYFSRKERQRVNAAFNQINIEREKLGKEKQEIEAQKKQLALRQDDLNKLSDQLQKQKEQLDNDRTEIEKIQKELEAQREAIEREKNQVEAEKQAIKKEKQQIETEKSKIEEKQNELTSKEQEIQDRENELKEKTNKLEKRKRFLTGDEYERYRKLYQRQKIFYENTIQAIRPHLLTYVLIFLIYLLFNMKFMENILSARAQTIINGVNGGLVIVSLIIFYFLCLNVFKYKSVSRKIQALCNVSTRQSFSELIDEDSTFSEYLIDQFISRLYEDNFGCPKDLFFKLESEAFRLRTQQILKNVFTNYLLKDGFVEIKGKSHLSTVYAVKKDAA